MKPPKATSTYLLKLTPEQKAWLEEIAANSDIPISQVIMNALKQCNFKEPFPAQRRTPGERDEPGRDRAEVAMCLYCGEVKSIEVMTTRHTAEALVCRTCVDRYAKK